MTKKNMTDFRGFYLEIEDQERRRAKAEGVPFRRVSPWLACQELYREDPGAVPTIDPDDVGWIAERVGYKERAIVCELETLRRTSQPGFWEENWAEDRA